MQPAGWVEAPPPAGLEAAVTERAAVAKVAVVLAAVLAGWAAREEAAGMAGRMQIRRSGNST